MSWTYLSLSLVVKVVPGQLEPVCPGALVVLADVAPGISDAVRNINFELVVRTKSLQKLLFIPGSKKIHNYAS